MSSMSGNEETIQGSVLVVKQMYDDPSYIVNMTKRDQLVANFLISTSVILIYLCYVLFLHDISALHYCILR